MIVTGSVEDVETINNFVNPTSYCTSEGMVDCIAGGGQQDPTGAMR